MTITRVQGTPNAQANVLAVQNAVDQGGMVILEGTFPFNDNVDPTKRPQDSVFDRMVTVSKDVIIVGDQMPTIEGGHIPFRVEAPGCSVTIQGLRFVSPKSQAISVGSVKGLLVANCRIEGVVPAQTQTSPAAGSNSGIGVFVNSNPQGGVPNKKNPGSPENISGPLTIIDNKIDTVVTAVDVDGTVNTAGIAIFSAGDSAVGKEVDIRLCGNKIRNVTARAINLRHIGGRALIALNDIEPGKVSVTPSGADSNLPDVIHAFGSGSYLIAHNSIVCEWDSAAGIRVHSRRSFGEAIAQAIVTENDVIMRAPASAVFRPNSAGIAISGFAEAIKVTNNRIKGRARAALAVEAEGDQAPALPAAPANTQVVLNDLAGFHASPHGVLVGLVDVPTKPTDTLLVVRQTDLVTDNGKDTQTVRV
jgi:hypothetical protein